MRSDARTTRRDSTTPLGAVPATVSSHAAEEDRAHADPVGMRDFDRFYSEHRDEIGRALVFVLGDQSLGQEAVDEAMVRAYQKWPEIGASENPAGWVFVAGKRWGLSWRRGRRRERKREELVAGRQPAPADPAIADYLDLMQAMGELTADQRTIVACRYSLGLSVVETAELLDIKEGTVKSRLSRSVDRLRELTGADHDVGNAGVDR